MTKYSVSVVDCSTVMKRYLVVVWITREQQQIQLEIELLQIKITN